MWFNFQHVTAAGIAHVLKDKHMLPRCAVQGLGQGTPPQRAPQTHPPRRLEGGQPGWGGRHSTFSSPLSFTHCPHLALLKVTQSQHWWPRASMHSRALTWARTSPPWPSSAHPQPPAKHQSQEPAAVRAGQNLPAEGFWERPGIADHLPGPCTLADLSR